MGKLEIKIIAMKEPNIYFISYADEKYDAIQRQRNKELKEIGYFDDIFTFTRGWLESCDFYKDNQKILDEPRGGGWCAWKSYILQQTLHAVEPGSIVLYADVLDKISGSKDDFRECLFDLTEDHDVVLTSGKYLNKQYTKHHTFLGMAADTKQFRDAIMIEAGIILLKKTLQVQDLIEEYVYYSTQKDLIDGTLGEECPEFIDVRWDQSILSIMAVRYNLYQTDRLRKYITCNFYPIPI